MTIDRLHQEIKFRLNKLNSNHVRDLPAAYIDDAINKVSLDFVEIFYSGNNSKQYKFGFEVTQQRIDMLQTLVIPDKVLTSSSGTITNKKYIFDLPTSPKYMHFLRGVATNAACPDKELTVYITRHNDLSQKLIDINTQPSLAWNRVLGVIRSNKLEIYTKGFSVNSLLIDYITPPTKVFFSGYNTLESPSEGGYISANPKITSNLPEQYHDLLVDLVVQYLALTLQDNNLVALLQNQTVSKI